MSIASVFVCVCVLATFTLGQAGPDKRLLLHDDQTVVEKIHSLEATVALLNASLNMAITELWKAIQAESRKRCQVGIASFHELLCPQSPTGCQEDKNIVFNPVFSKPPVVSYSLDRLDIDATHNVRVFDSVSDVKTSGAVLSVHTWSDTHLYPTSLSWIACPSA